jgi:psp operon transcriptional activator
MATHSVFSQENASDENPVFGHFEALGQSKAFLDSQERLRSVAPINRPVLLIGERGTGKEMAAQKLHFLSPRWGQPFVTLNCSALAPSLIESELFGHERGAFTGATQQRIGRFEAANGGTLFLDEISLIPIETQEKILRVVEYGAFERVGGTRPVQVDVRIIGATNTDLSQEAALGRFKPDLLDRLSFEVLFLPPLRERREDIMLIAGHFASRMAFELGRVEIPEFSDEAVARLMNHSWPGNIRELKNVVERAVYRSESAGIDEIEFDPFKSPYAPAAPFQPARGLSGGVSACDELSRVGAAGLATSPPPLGPDVLDLGGALLPDALGKVELHFLRRALKAARYNQRVAAKMLGLTYDQFRRLYRKYAKELKGEEE